MVPITVHTARWVVPVAGPVIEAGAVAVADGRIIAAGPAAELRRQPWDAWEDHGDGAILPGLVNAHTHLEFAALRGRLAPTERLGDWLSAALAGFAELPCDDLIEGVERAAQEAIGFGTILLAEVSNTGLSLPLVRHSGLAYHYFFECLGFDLLGDGPLEADFPFLAAPGAQADPHVSVAAHAPYSASAMLFGRIAAWNRDRGQPASVHLAESREEVDFLQRGDGCFRDLLIQRQRWYEGYRPPGCSPAVYLDGLGFLGPQTLAVHGLWLTAADRELLARRGAPVVLCPRSNLFTGAGFPDLPTLFQAGVRLALGTDSLASNQDMNLFRELAALRERFPETPPPRLIRLATLDGALALGRQADLGSLEPGKQAALLFLPVAAGEGDFWDALLSAGAAGEVRWLTPPPKEIRHD